MNMKWKALLGVAGVALASQAIAQITFYEDDNFRGRVFATDKPISNFDGYGFNDKASSVIVERGDWEVCEDSEYRGHCVVLHPGRYDSLRGMGMNDRISSVRHANMNVGYSNAPAPPPPPMPAYAYQQQPGEQLFQAQVTSVHAVVGPPEQRCWVERQQVVQDRSGPNVAGAVIGGVIGGVLGHQIGSGRGNDVATVGGAVAGAAIGANTNRGGTTTVDRDVQRCEQVPSQAQPDYWDVTYVFQGVEHRAQLSGPPGQTITVNGYGEPRG